MQNPRYSLIQTLYQTMELLPLLLAPSLKMENSLLMVLVKVVLIGITSMWVFRVNSIRRPHL